MRIENPKLLASCRVSGRCAWCGKWCKTREAAHIFSRSAGRLDIPINLAILGSTPNFACECHTRHHAGHEPTQSDLLAIVAQRENCLQSDIVSVVHLLLRVPRGSLFERWHEEAMTLNLSARTLLFKTLEVSLDVLQCECGIERLLEDM